MRLWGTRREAVRWGATIAAAALLLSAPVAFAQTAPEPVTATVTVTQDDAGLVKIEAKLRNTTGTPLTGDLRLEAGEATATLPLGSGSAAGGDLECTGGADLAPGATVTVVCTMAAPEPPAVTKATATVVVDPGLLDSRADGFVVTAEGSDQVKATPGTAEWVGVSRWLQPSDVPPIPLNVDSGTPCERLKLDATPGFVAGGGDVLAVTVTCEPGLPGEPPALAVSVCEEGDDDDDDGEVGAEEDDNGAESGDDDGAESGDDDTGELEGLGCLGWWGGREVTGSVNVIAAGETTGAVKITARRVHGAAPAAATLILSLVAAVAVRRWRESTRRVVEAADLRAHRIRADAVEHADLAVGEWVISPGVIAETERIRTAVRRLARRHLTGEGLKGDDAYKKGVDAALDDVDDLLQAWPALETTRAAFQAEWVQQHPSVEKWAPAYAERCRAIASAQGGLSFAQAKDFASEIPLAVKLAGQWVATAAKLAAIETALPNATGDPRQEAGEFLEALKVAATAAKLKERLDKIDEVVGMLNAAVPGPAVAAGAGGDAPPVSSPPDPKKRAAAKQQADDMARRLSGFRNVMLTLILVLLATVAVVGGLQALYVDKVWGSPWDYLVAFAWGFTAGALADAVVDLVGRRAAPPPALT